MLPAKEEVRRLLELLPDDASLEDIQYHIYVCQKIMRGLEENRRGGSYAFRRGIRDKDVAVARTVRNGRRGQRCC